MGLDGDGSATTEQTGSEADCSGGVPVYSSWYEMYPDAPVTYSDPVRAGDRFTASVTSLGSNQFALTIADATQGWTHTANMTSASAKLASAEVIAEAPTGPAGILPLTDFSTASFTGAQANGRPIGAADPQALTMTRPDGTVKATPSVLTDGTDFSTVPVGGLHPAALGFRTQMAAHARAPCWPSWRPRWPCLAAAAGPSGAAVSTARRSATLGPASAGWRSSVPGSTR